MSNTIDPMKGVFQGLDIISSGLRAELQRADVVSANLGNMHSTGNKDRLPYCRKAVEFAEVLDNIDSLKGVPGGEQMAAGVKVSRVYDDRTAEFSQRSEPSHKDAGSDGMVWSSNVDMFQELVDMTAIERSFEANLQAMRTYRQMLQNTITNLSRS